MYRLVSNACWREKEVECSWGWMPWISVMPCRREFLDACGQHTQGLEMHLALVQNIPLTSQPYISCVLDVKVHSREPCKLFGKGAHSKNSKPLFGVAVGPPPGKLGCSTGYRKVPVGMDREGLFISSGTSGTSSGTSVHLETRVLFQQKTFRTWTTERTFL
jgi:hypothetical protein